jgi:hypothetical protein
MGLINTMDKITIDDEKTKSQDMGKFPIRNLNERAKFDYFWNYFNILIQDEFDEPKWDRRLPKEGEWEARWKKYNGRKKILFTLLWTIKETAMKRAKMLGRNCKQELKENENYWQNFGLRWRNAVETAKNTNYNWKEFIQLYGSRLIEYWVMEEFIKGNEARKGMNKIMEEKFRPVDRNRNYGSGGCTYVITTERSKCQEAIEKFKKLLEGQDNEIWIWKVGLNIEEEKQREWSWLRMKELKFQEEEPPELECHTESITIEGSLTIIEDEYEQITPRKRIIPTSEDPYITTKIEKIANEEMDLMYECLKKQFQGRIYRKPRDIEEFMDDMLIYFKRNQTRRQEGEVAASRILSLALRGFNGSDCLRCRILQIPGNACQVECKVPIPPGVFHMVFLVASVRPSNCRNVLKSHQPSTESERDGSESAVWPS